MDDYFLKNICACALLCVLFSLSAFFFVRPGGLHVCRFIRVVCKDKLSNVCGVVLLVLCCAMCVAVGAYFFYYIKRCVGRLGLCGWAVWRVCCAFLFLLLCFAGGEIMAFGVLQGVFFMEKVIFF